MKEIPISVVIIAKNEAFNLALSLPKLSWCNDIILVDSNSEDETVAVAEKFGAKVFNNKFEGFGAQKQFAVSKAKHDWVLNIDADEVLSDQIIAELVNLNIENTAVVGYEIPRRHFFLGKEFKYGRESKSYYLRLFNKNFGNFDLAVVHEKVLVNGKTEKLKSLMNHYSYHTLEQFFVKFNQYTSAGAIKLSGQHKTRSRFASVAFFPFYFIKHFLIYKNFINGYEGFLWSYLSAWYHVVKYLKLNELNKNLRS